MGNPRPAQIDVALLEDLRIPLVSILDGVIQPKRPSDQNPIEQPHHLPVTDVFEKLGDDRR